MRLDLDPFVSGAEPDCPLCGDWGTVRGDSPSGWVPCPAGCGLPEDDEPVARADVAAVARGHADKAAGRTIPFVNNYLRAQAHEPRHPINPGDEGGLIEPRAPW